MMSLYESHKGKKVEDYTKIGIRGRTEGQFLLPCVERNLR